MPSKKLKKYLQGGSYDVTKPCAEVIPHGKKHWFLVLLSNHTREPTVSCLCHALLQNFKEHVELELIVPLLSPIISLMCAHTNIATTASTLSPTHYLYGYSTL